MSAAWNSLTGQNSTPAVQWGQGNSAATTQQNQQKGLGQAAVNQAQGYANTMGQQGAQEWGQYQNLGAQYGQQGQQQYGALQGAQAQGNLALGQLADAAAGKTPSAAAIQMQQGLDQAAKQQMAMAGATRGGFGLANANKQAMDAGAQMQQSGVDQAAALRAQEMAAAQQAYMQGSLGMGGLANNAAQGFQGQQLGALQAGTNAQLGYEQSGQNAVTAGEGLQQGYEGQGIGIQNSASQTSLGNSQLQQQQQQSNAAASNALIGGLVSAAGAVGSGGLSLIGQGAAKAAQNAGSGGFNGMLPSDARVKKDVADASYSQGVEAGVQAATTPQVLARTGSMPPYLAASGGAPARVMGPHGYVPAAQPAPTGDAAIPTTEHAAYRGPISGPTPAEHPPVLKAGGKMLVAAPTGYVPAQPPAEEGPYALTSDERVKGEYRPDGGEPPADRFLGSLKPKTFSYQSPSYEPNPDGPGDRYLGVMAQDLERTPEGRKLVSPGPDGVKRVDVPSLAGASAAALGRLHERLLRLEGRQRAGVR